MSPDLWGCGDIGEHNRNYLAQEPSALIKLPLKVTNHLLLDGDRSGHGGRQQGFRR